MPSMPQTRREIIGNIVRHYGDCEGLNIYDLGSGWGGLCRQLQNKLPLANIVGWEISPVTFMISKFISLFGHYSIRRQDIFKMDLSNVDIIICYLSNYHMDKLTSKIINTDKKKIIVYTQGFPLQGLDPIEVVKIPYSIEKKLYRYELQK